MGKDTLNELCDVRRSLVSIIVPVYRVEPYLDKCVQSIVTQTYRNIEVFLVDDGSPDQCGKMCDGYAEQYPYIHVIHQANQGQAAARNHAAKYASGEYIAFIDSDDFVEPDCIEYLVSLQEKYHTDLAIGGFRYIYEGAEPQRRPSKENDCVLSGCEALIRMNYNRGIGATPWAKLYKRELVLKYPFPEGQIYEDLAVLYKIVGACEHVAFGNRKIYYWVQRSGSTMRMAFDERQMAGMDAVSEQLDYVQVHYPEAIESVRYRYAAKAVELIAVCFSSGGNRNVFKRLQKMTDRFGDEVLRDKKTKLTMKARIIATHLGYLPARLVFAIHEMLKKLYMR